MHHEKENRLDLERKIAIQLERIKLLEERIVAQRKQIKRLMMACPFRQTIREALFYLGLRQETAGPRRAAELLRAALEDHP